MEDCWCLLSVSVSKYLNYLFKNCGGKEKKKNIKKRNKRFSTFAEIVTSFSFRPLICKRNNSNFYLPGLGENCIPQHQANELGTQCSSKLNAIISSWSQGASPSLLHINLRRPGWEISLDSPSFKFLKQEYPLLLLTLRKEECYTFVISKMMLPL